MGIYRKRKKKMGICRVEGGGCGGFPEPEVKEIKEEKACCHGGCVQCNRETGCGFGPVKDGSVQDASGASVLSQKNNFEEHLYFIVELDTGFKFILNDEQFSVFRDAMGFYQRSECKRSISAGVRGREFGSEVESWQVIYLSHVVRWCEYISSKPQEPIGCTTVEKKSSGSWGHIALDPGGLFGW